MPFQIQTSHQTLLLQWCSSSSKVHCRATWKMMSNVTYMCSLTCLRETVWYFMKILIKLIHSSILSNLHQFLKANKNNISDLARGGLLPSLLYLRMHHSTNLFAMTTNESSQSSSSFYQYLWIFSVKAAMKGASSCKYFVAWNVAAKRGFLALSCSCDVIKMV